jgi:hypothetical protein
MNARVEAFIEQARCLDREERIAALDALQELVTPPGAAWEAAWAVEAEDRIAVYERGENSNVLKGKKGATSCNPLDRS